MSEWIKCSDRLPTENDTDDFELVLVLHSFGMRDTMKWHRIEAWNMRAIQRDKEEQIITHWMPLPELPKEENTTLIKTDTEHAELEEAAMPLLKLLNKRYNPMCYAIVYMDGAKIVSTEVGVPLLTNY